MAHGNFEFKAWLQEYELDEVTETALLDKGFNSYKSLRCLPLQDIPRLFKGVKAAQMYLLEEAVSLLHPDKATENTVIHTAPEPVTEKTTPADTTNAMTVDDVMKLWQQTIGAQPARTATTEQGKVAPTFDPYDLGCGQQGNKYRDIRQYVTTVGNTSDEDTVQIGGMNFKLAMDKKIQLEKMRMPQYMEASMKILSEMIVEDGISASQILAHISYLTKVAAFAQDFNLQSVLEYDTVYTKLQSKQGFACDFDSAYLMQKHLKPYSPSSTKPTDAKKATQAPTDPKSGKPVCFKWNGRYGCDLYACNFAHVCKSCFKEDHNEANHQQAKK